MMISMNAETYIEKYIELIDNENWNVFWEGCWYFLDNKETERLIDLLEKIGISKQSHHSIREELFIYWIGQLLNVCPDRKDTATFLYGDVRNHFGLTDDEIYDIFIQEIDKRNDILELDDEAQTIRKRIKL